ncbi:MAG: PAS domain S-box protein [Pseudomonadota bacterium]
MKITHKLIISFWLIVVCIWSVNFYAIAETKKRLENVLIQQDVRLMEELTSGISQLLYTRLETVMEYTNDVLLRTALEESNTVFAEYPDRDTRINATDTKWTALLDASGNSLFKDLLINSLSEELREKQEYYRERYDYDLYKEIFVTNRYGAVAGLTGPTTDYRQDDEEWWQTAKKTGLHISDIAFHESVGAYSLDFTVRVTDEHDVFLGVIKAVYNIDEILHLLERRLERGEDNSLDYILATENGRVLYSSTKQERFLEDISQKNYFIKASESSGYLALQEDGKFYTKSAVPGHKEMRAPGWILIDVHNVEDLFAPVTNLRTKLVFFASAVTFFVFLLSLFVNRDISRPLIGLKNAVVAFGGGRLDGEIPVASKDEIGEVAAAFNAMISKLRETTVSRDSLAVEIEERKRLEKEIRESEKKLSSIIGSLLSGIIIIDAETHNIIDANPAALELIGLPREKVIGQQCHAFICPAEKGKCPVTDLSVTIDHSERILVNHEGEKVPILKSVSSEIISGRRCLIESFIDISDRKKAEQEKEQLISELQDALAQVKTLSGIVPICMHCKNIRDDKGYWTRVENFVAQHSEAKFSHGICDQCLKVHYPECVDDKDDASVS